MDFLSLVIRPDAPADMTFYKTAMDVLFPLMPIFGLIAFISFILMFVRLFSPNMRSALKPFIIFLITGALAFGSLVGYIDCYIKISRANMPKVVEFDHLELELNETYAVEDLADYYQTSLDRLSITSVTFENSSSEPSYEISEDKKSLIIYEGDGDIVIGVHCYSHESYNFQISGTIAK